MFFTCAKYCSVYFVCASIHAPTAGSFLASSHRYGSVIVMPSIVSVTGFVSVAGGGPSVSPCPPWTTAPFCAAAIVAITKKTRRTGRTFVLACIFMPSFVPCSEQPMGSQYQVNVILSEEGCLNRRGFAEIINR